METLLKKTQAYELLRAEGRENRFGHAYLLHFDDGKNLTTALKTFAKLFFADRADAARVERLIDEDSFADCLRYPEADKKLTVDDAENIREESLLSPVEGEHKLFLLGDFAEANAQTQNKLLKLLEEPPQGVVFLLGTTSIFPVLPTVLSRTERLEILPFTPQEVSACLSRMYGERYEKEAYSLCAAATGGNVGEAQNVLEGGYFQELLNEAFSLALCEDGALPSVVKNIGETKYKKQLLAFLRLIFRDGLLWKIDGGKTNAFSLPSETTKTRKVAGRYATNALLFAQEALTEAEKQVQFNAVFSQCIELCVADIRAHDKRVKENKL